MDDQKLTEEVRWIVNISKSRDLTRLEIDLIKKRTARLRTEIGFLEKEKESLYTVIEENRPKPTKMKLQLYHQAIKRIKSYTDEQATAWIDANTNKLRCNAKTEEEAINEIKTIVDGVCWYCKNERWLGDPIRSQPCPEC